MSKFPENVVQYTDVTRGEYSHIVNECTAIIIGGEDVNATMYLASRCMWYVEFVT